MERDLDGTVSIAVIGLWRPSHHFDESKLLEYRIEYFALTDLKLFDRRSRVEP